MISTVSHIWKYILLRHEETFCEVQKWLLYQVCCPILIILGPAKSIELDIQPQLNIFVFVLCRRRPVLAYGNNRASTSKYVTRNNPHVTTGLYRDGLL